ncbi:hypothetical protein AEP_01652 [Curvibacter sp. AEP1-3]|uniref:hypothetical protein n=1 Tax=Curvibacter sp. AEP1-3 TaxID=1844971 RepID=UPI000B552BC3|nr:hypothetical protein [Curvibacter sp. AEP1-3]ARV18596.1 hypothetical protein AEP_01652 [Curvibacter sp. AEP1-3]
MNNSVLKQCRAGLWLALCFATASSWSQPSTAKANAEFRESIAQVRARMGLVGPGKFAPVGKDSLPELLDSLEQMDNLEQVCTQGLGNVHLCTVRSATLAGTQLGAGIPGVLDLDRLDRGFGAAIRSARSHRIKLTQTQTKAQLQVDDWNRHWVSRTPPAPGLVSWVEGLLGQLPSIQLNGEPLLPDPEHVALAGALLTDTGRALLQSLAAPLERCAPRNLQDIGADRAWYGSRSAKEMWTCLENVLASPSSTQQLQAMGHLLQLPELWRKQGALQLDDRYFNDRLTELSAIGQWMSVAKIEARTDAGAETPLQIALPFKAGDVACRASNSYCRSQFFYSAGNNPCTLDGKQLPGALDCQKLHKLLDFAQHGVLNSDVFWSIVFDALRVLQGKPAQLSEIQRYTEWLNAVTEASNNVTQPQAGTSVLLVKFRQISVPLLGVFSKQVWVVDAIQMQF